MKLSTNKAIFDKHRRERRARAWRRLFALGGSAVAALIVAIVVLRLPALQIQEIRVTGTKVVAAATVEDRAAVLLAGAYARLVPRRNLLLYPKEEIRQALLREFLNIAAISFTEASSGTLYMAVTERSPESVWCEGEFAPVAPRHCFYVDASGMLYDQAPEFSGPVYFEWYGSAKLRPKLGEALLPPSSWALATTVRTNIRNLAVVPVALVVQPDQSYELITSKGWRLLFDDTSKPDEVINHLAATLGSDVFAPEHRRGSGVAGSPIDRTRALDYIDLRFGKKIFYKFKVPETATTTPHA